MGTILTKEETKHVIMKHLHDERYMINILYFKDKESILKKIEITNLTLGSTCKLRSKGFDNGVFGLLNDLTSTSKRFRNCINIICVPDDIMVTINKELSDEIRNVYIVTNNDIHAKSVKEYLVDCIN